MRFGMQVMNSNLYGDSARLHSGSPRTSDADRIRADLELIDMGDRSGLDTVWASEHHFSSYMTTPNLCEYLAYIVGRTKSVDVGTAVIVLPWHDPVRVAEEVAMLDILVGDRTLFVGFGRGASTLEFDGFRVPMSESRARYDDALEIVRRLLTEERVSFDGEFHKIPEITTHPRPKSADLGARMYNAWMSPSSLDLAASSGVCPLFAVMRPLDQYPQEMARFNAVRAEVGLPPTTAKIQSFMYCAASRAQAEDEGIQFISQYYDTLEEHYHWGSGGYRDVKGYEFYADLGEQRAKASKSQTTEALIECSLLGTPDDIVQKIEHLGQVAHCDEVISPFIYGKMPFDKAEAQMKLFLEKALPRIHKLPVVEPAAVA
jgi:alkanesulfonate monooxygenase SsuD/methylene tetrahydromethanopterin reductase-like flavin-dependent oxidoreductase (luciferase family)